MALFVIKGNYIYNFSIFEPYSYFLAFLHLEEKTSKRKVKFVHSNFWFMEKLEVGLNHSLVGLKRLSVFKFLA